MNKQDKQELERLREEKLNLHVENAELRLKLDEYQWQMDEIRKQEQEIYSLHRNVRKLKHDMRNHLMVVTSYLNNGEYEKAREYTSDIIESLNAIHSYVETGNSLLDHILNEKLSLAREKGIDVSAQIDQARFEKMKGIDFAAVLNNLLDNAIEASEKETEKEIQVKVFRKKGYDAVSVKNRIACSVLADNPKLQSRKNVDSRQGDDAEQFQQAAGSKGMAQRETAAHGFGVVQIKETVDRYQGMYDFYEEDGFFCVNIFIPQ